MGRLSKTSIQWCTHTVNPVIAINPANERRGWQCTKIAAGCQNCYAERLNLGRFGNGLRFDVKGAAAAEWLFDPNAIESVLRRTAPAAIFWCDMTDLFHEAIPAAWIVEVLNTCAATPHLRHLILTKRPARMRDVVEGWLAGSAPPANLGLGVSVAEPADLGNVEDLVEIPAALRFVSYEPAIRFVRLRPWLAAGVDVVIVGGESGPNARPFDLAWARRTIADCNAAGAVPMVKQLGRYVITSDPHDDPAEFEPAPPQGEPSDGIWATQLVDSHGGDPSEWPADLRPYAATPEAWPWKVPATS